MKILIIILLLFNFNIINAQEEITTKIISDSYIRIMFYNVENLFDTKNDSIKNDDEFLPTNDKFWTSKKYYAKVNQISKVIAAIGKWNPPAIIGLCEIENRYALNSLVNYSSLKNLNYKIIHKESPDFRGIDVALIYKENLFKVIFYKAIEINFPFSPESTTRDILYVKGTTKTKDTLHVFVNHWPSRWGGQMQSEERRMFVASVLKNTTDSIFITDKNASIVIMGDFNDYPYNKSLTEVLKANREYSDIQPDKLYNLSAYLQEASNLGTHKHEGKWGVLDQIIVSGSLLNTKNKTFTSKENVHIFDADFLLVEDEAYSGKKPYRTYIGFRYIGGFSDHLPVYLDVFFND
ncbi:MAG: hypothetical protein JXR51_10270 [Bacteroidales bacterium]|nr:hypothetical protein [Bacteroidales bacterium]MBN2757551.1 hypothetical protein [Bacteroidales bacterium]